MRVNKLFLQINAQKEIQKIVWTIKNFSYSKQSETTPVSGPPIPPLFFFINEGKKIIPEDKCLKTNFRKLFGQ